MPSESLRTGCGGAGCGGAGEEFTDGAWYIINPQKSWLLLIEMKPNLNPVPTQLHKEDSGCLGKASATYEIEADLSYCLTRDYRAEQRGSKPDRYLTGRVPVTPRRK